MIDAGLLGVAAAWFRWWQLPLLVVLIALIIGLVMYRRRQM